MMKKTLTTILLGATLCTILVSGPVFAEGISNISPSVIQAEREDVSLEEALQDPTFDINPVAYTHLDVYKRQLYETDRSYETDRAKEKGIGGALRSSVYRPVILSLIHICHQ